MKRKLAAIFSADVQGYSRLMERDEAHTIELLVASKALMSSSIESCGGIVVDAPGDNLLAQFASVVDAVRCALQIQEKLAERNAGLSPDRRMEFRIGINLGDVVTDGGRIYGDGVNVAARLESLAEAGGICISGSAYDQVRKRLDFGCEYLGKKQVKNISSPVDAYRIRPSPGRDECRIVPEQPRRPRSISMRIPAAALLVLLAISGIYWLAARTGPPSKEPAKRPSIAIFPFENVSDDPAQNYFTTGFTRDLLTDLAKFGELVVVEGSAEGGGLDEPVDYAAEGRKMNVRYVLAGSVRKEADRLRINARLVRSKSGRHIWTARYDRRMSGVFEVQDAIVEAIARKLAVEIEESERQRVFRKGTENLDAYDHLLRGLHHFYKRTRADNREARAHFSAALELDPQYTEAYVGLADTRVFDVVYGFTEFPRKAFQEARQYVDAALAIDPNNAGAHSTKGYLAMRTGAYELAVEELRRAIDLNPNDWRSYRYLGAVLLYSGQPEEALRWYELAMTYAPVTTPGMHMNVGIIHFLEGRYDEAERWLRRAADRWPAFLGTHIVLAATYAEIGSPEAAAKEVAAVHKISPFFNPEIYGSAYRNPVHRAKIVNALQKAGLGM